MVSTHDFAFENDSQKHYTSMTSISLNIRNSSQLTYSYVTNGRKIKFMSLLLQQRSVYFFAHISWILIRYKVVRLWGNCLTIRHGNRLAVYSKCKLTLFLDRFFYTLVRKIKLIYNRRKNLIMTSFHTANLALSSHHQPTPKITSILHCIVLVKSIFNNSH